MKTLLIESKKKLLMSLELDGFKKENSSELCMDFEVFYPDQNDAYDNLKVFFEEMEGDFQKISKDQFSKCLATIIKLTLFFFEKQTSGFSKNAKYINFIMSTITSSTRQIYQADNLVKYFACEKEEDNRNIESGREAINNFYNYIFIPISSFSQLKEIEEGNFQICSLDQRRRLLIESRNIYDRIPSKLKSLMKIKVLGGDVSNQLHSCSEYNINLFQQFFKNIAKLSADLHQGTLLTRVIYDINEEFNLYPKVCHGFTYAVKLGAR